MEELLGAADGLVDAGLVVTLGDTQHARGILQQLVVLVLTHYAQQLRQDDSQRHAVRDLVQRR